MSEKQIKLVVSDLDGTLLNSDRQIQAEAVEAVKRLQERGIKFSFISGRPMYAMDAFAKQVPVSAPLVSCNGALIYEGEMILERHSMKLSGLRSLLLQAADAGMTVLYYANGRECSLTETEWVCVRKRLGRDYPVRPLGEEEWAESSADKVNIMNDGDPQLFMDLEAEIRKLDQEYSIVRYGTLGCEISAKGVSKAAALKSLSRILGIGLEEILAVGDNENDNEMLRLAGIGAAVANAQESTKACADYICANSQSLGVAEAIERFCL